MSETIQNDTVIAEESLTSKERIKRLRGRGAFLAGVSAWTGSAAVANAVFHNSNDIKPSLPSLALMTGLTLASAAMAKGSVDDYVAARDLHSEAQADRIIAAQTVFAQAQQLEAPQE